MSDPSYEILPKRGQCLLSYRDEEYKDKEKTKAKCIEDPTYAIFLKSSEFKDIKYETHSDHQNPHFHQNPQIRQTDQIHQNLQIHQNQKYHLNQ